MTILVVWTTMQEGPTGRVMLDDYQVFSSAEVDEANARYAEVLELDDLYTASICGVLKSTDYDPGSMIQYNKEVVK